MAEEPVFCSFDICTDCSSRVTCLEATSRTWSVEQTAIRSTCDACSALCHQLTFTNSNKFLLPLAMQTLTLRLCTWGTSSLPSLAAPPLRGSTPFRHARQLELSRKTQHVRCHGEPMVVSETYFREKRLRRGLRCATRRDQRHPSTSVRGMECRRPNAVWIRRRWPCTQGLVVCFGCTPSAMLFLLYFERLTQRCTGLPFVVKMLTSFVSHCHGNICPGNFVLRSTGVCRNACRLVGKCEHRHYDDVCL